MKTRTKILCLLLTTGIIATCSGSRDAALNGSAGGGGVPHLRAKALTNDQLISHGSGTTGSLANDQTQPAIAYDTVTSTTGTGNYLVVWTDYRNQSTDCGGGVACGTDIYGAICTGSGSGTTSALSCGDSFVIASAVGNQMNPRVAFYPDPTLPAPGNSRYLVVWTDTRHGSFSVIEGQYVDTTGTLVGPGNFQISTNDNPTDNTTQLDPDVIYDAVKNTFVVTWVNTSILDTASNYFLDTKPTQTWTTFPMVLGPYTSTSDIASVAVEQSNGIPVTDYAVSTSGTTSLSVTIGSSSNINGVNTPLYVYYGNVAELRGSTCPNAAVYDYIQLPSADNYVVQTVEVDPALGTMSNLKNVSGLVFTSPFTENTSAKTFSATWSVQFNESKPKLAYSSLNGDYFAGWGGMNHVVTFSSTYSQQTPSSHCDYSSPSFATSSSDANPKIIVRKNTGLGMIQDLSFGTNASSPALVADPNTNRMLVAWEDNDGGTSTGKNIYAQLLDLGNFLNYGDQISVSNAVGDQTAPVVSYDNVNQRFMVTWEDARNQSANISNIDIYSQFVDPQGNLSGGNSIVTVASGNQLMPAVAFGDNNFRDFLVAWADGRDPSQSDIYGQLLQYSTAPQLVLTNYRDDPNNPILNSAINFGAEPTSSVTTTNFYIWNNGNTQLTINSMSIPDTPFAFTTSTPVTISPGTSYLMTVSFSPLGAGSFAGNSSNNFKTTIDSDGGQAVLYFSGSGVGVNPLQVTSSSPLSDATLNVPYSTTLTASGGNYPYTFSSSTLPAGLTLNTSTGVLSGTPTVAGTYTITVTVTDNTTPTPSTASKDLTLTVQNPAALQISTTLLSSWTQTVEYSLAPASSIQATGGTGSYAWSIQAGSLPPGMSIGTPSSNPAQLNGVPTNNGAYTFTAAVTDGSTTASKSFTVTINPVPVILTTSLPSSAVLLSYNQTIALAGGTGPYTWSITSGSLPAGLNLNTSSGVISGIPTAAGTYTFTVRAVDSAGAKATASLSIVITGPLDITSAPSTTLLMPYAQIGVAYSYTFIASGGNVPYSWSITAGPTSPSGLTLNADTGQLSGTPNTSGTYYFTLQVKDQNGTTVSKTYTLIVFNAISLTTASLSQWTQGVAGYSQTLNVTGGSGSYNTWAVSSGTVPPGLTLTPGSAPESQATLAGTPTTAGTYNFTVTVTDSNGLQGSKAYSVTINSPLSISTTALASGTTGELYSATPSFSGGTSPYVWSLSSGTLPAGLSLDTLTGAITGIPTSLGTSALTLKVTDAPGATTTKNLSISVYDPVAITTISPLPKAINGKSYSTTLAATGGHTPYTWTLTGILPSGLSFDPSTGVLSGTTTASGVYSLTSVVTDADGRSTSKSFNLTVTQPLAISAAVLPAQTMLQSYPSQTLVATGGTPTYVNWTYSGQFPPGLQLNSSTGVISDASGSTPYKPGVYTFTVSVADADSVSATRSFTITINAQPYISTTSLPDGVQNASYSASLAASSGTTPYSWSINSGSLPTGLNLDSSTGTIAGTPTTSGSSSFDIQLTDASGTVVTSPTYTITVYPTLAVATTSPMPNGTSGTAYSQTLSATGGQTPITWSTAGGTLPAGLTLDGATGVISGTPTTGGTYIFIVKATDSNGNAATKTLQITVISTTIGAANVVYLSNGLQVSYVAYGNVLQGTSLTRSVTVQNTGTSAADVTAVSTSDAAFTAALGVPFTLGAAGSGTDTKTFDITFTPTSVTSYAATLTVTTSGGNAILNLTGSGSNVYVLQTGGSGAVSYFAELTPLPSAPTGFTPRTAADFVIDSMTAGDTAAVDVSFVSMPANPTFYILVNNVWTPLTPTAVTGNVVTFSVQDGGPLDADSTAGKIHCTVVVGTSSGAAGVGTGTSSGGGATTRRSGCFIATAAYGSYIEPHVMVLRRFRDHHLLTNAPGRAFVELYYTYSPPIADFIRQHDVIRVIVRWSLVPLIVAVEFPKMFFASLLAIALVLLRRIISRFWEGRHAEIG